MQGEPSGATVITLHWVRHHWILQTHDISSGITTCNTLSGWFSHRVNDRNMTDSFISHLHYLTCQGQTAQMKGAQSDPRDITLTTLQQLYTKRSTHMTDLVISQFVTLPTDWVRHENNTTHGRQGDEMTGSVTLTLALLHKGSDSTYVTGIWQPVLIIRLCLQVVFTWKSPTACEHQTHGKSIHITFIIEFIWQSQRAGKELTNGRPSQIT